MKGGMKMEFKEVTNAKGRKTYFVDGRRVGSNTYAYLSADLTGYNSSCSWTENGKRYHTFCTKGE